MFARRISLINTLRKDKVCVKFIGKSYTVESKVRVRFAPSPTGHLHLGGLRTALYNYLFAKAHNGDFILRIEDTDQSRIVHDAVGKLENDLLWVGIVPDESPTKGGKFGSYKQSERLHLYSEQVQQLLKSGAAYRCFCTDRRLDLLRREALKARQVPRYDNRCRSLSEAEVQVKLERGDPHCVRFKLLSSAEPFNDLVYGSISYDVAQNEGDPVIIKTDRFPTYHFANVVDDHFMKVTHVLRGVEWQISTTKHLLLYKAFGWHPPEFAHLPLILNPDGSKLSKRQGDIHVDSYRDGGIFPLALINFVTNAGGGFLRDLDKVKPRIYLMQELASQFRLERINPNSCRLMPERLGEFSSLELQRQLLDETSTAVLVQRVKDIVSQAFHNKEEKQSLHLEDDHVRSILLWGQKRIQRLGDLVDKNLAFLWVTPASCDLQNSSLDLLMQVTEGIRSVPECDFHREKLTPLLRDFASRHGVQFSQLMKQLRSVLSGLKEGPGVAEMMEILGPQSTVSRLEAAVARIKHNKH